MKKSKKENKQKKNKESQRETEPPPELMNTDEFSLQMNTAESGQFLINSDSIESQQLLTEIEAEEEGEERIVVPDLVMQLTDLKNDDAQDPQIVDLLESSQHGKIVAGFKFNDYPTNKVDSRKYTLKNFFPKAVFP